MISRRIADLERRVAGLPGTAQPSPLDLDRLTIDEVRTLDQLRTKIIEHGEQSLSDRERMAALLLCSRASRTPADGPFDFDRLDTDELRQFIALCGRDQSIHALSDPDAATFAQLLAKATKPEFQPLIGANNVPLT